MFKSNKNYRIGTKLEDGVAAHAADHNQWSRRQFLSGTSMMAAGGLILGSSPLLSWASPLLTALTEDPDNDRVLILIRLKGGNDGLNTIVPYGDNLRRIQYEGWRQSVKLSCSNLLPLEIDIENNTLNSEFALPNYATEMHNMWEDSNMAVIHNVGAAGQSGSHFLGSDLMASGATNTSQYSDVRRYTGFMGRYFDQSLPAFLAAPPTTPPVIQIGSSSNLIFRGSKGTPYDLVFSDLTAFEEVLQNGQLYSTAMFGDPACAPDIERTFVRNVANSTLRYAETVQQAYHASSDGDYGMSPSNLSQQLSRVARLIKGGLKTKIYMVSLGGFDTHVAQRDAHTELIQTLSKAVSDFHNDLNTEGHGERVLTMTFSEFGRTVDDNGNDAALSGTDHGSLAPVMLFGNAVKGKSFYGTPIDLSADKVDGNGLVHFADKGDTKGQTGAIDFRHVYEKVLRDWLCVDAQTVDNVLLRTPEGDTQGNHNYDDCSSANTSTETNTPPYDSDCAQSADTTPHAIKGCTDPLGGMIIGGCQSTVSQSSTLDAYIASLVTLGYNIKEGDNTKVEIKYATKTNANIKLQILESDGSQIGYTVFSTATELRPLVEKYQEAGSYIYEFDSQPEIDSTTVNILSPNTNYICRIEVNGMVVERTLSIH